MARAKNPTVLSFTRGPSDEARAEVYGGIDRLLVFANLHKDDSSEDARKVHRVLTQLSEATDRWYDGDSQPMKFNLPGAWPPGAVVAVANLAALLRQSRPRIYLRLCPECRQWCLTKNKKQIRRCHRPSCFLAAESRRVRTWQREEQVKHKASLARIKASRTR